MMMKGLKMNKLIFLLLLCLGTPGILRGADVAVQDMTATTAPASTDVLYLVVNPAVTPLDRKVTIGNLFGTASWNSSTQTLSLANITATTLLTATASSLGIADATSLNLSGLTASRCVVTDGSKNLASATTACPILGANTFTALQTITQASANAGIVASTGYSLTGSNATSMIDLAGTLNTSGSPDVVAFRITDTARGATTKLLNIYAGAAGATTMFNIDRLGLVTVPGLSGNSGYSFGNGNVVVQNPQTNVLGLYANGNQLWVTTNVLQVPSGSSFGWSSGAINLSNTDTQIFRKGAGIVGAGTTVNGTTDGTFQGHFKAANGISGVSGTCAGFPTVVDGLITACTGI